MSKMSQTKTMIVASIIGLILLSGCVDNKTTNQTTTPTPTNTPITLPSKTPIPPTPLPVTTIKQNVSSNTTSNLSTKSPNGTSNALTPPDSDWCKIGSVKKIAGKDFTIVGAENRSGTELCKLKLEEKNGNTTAYVTKSGSVVQMNSTATSANGSASASASSSTTNTKI